MLRQKKGKEIHPGAQINKSTFSFKISTKNVFNFERVKTRNKRNNEILQISHRSSKKKKKNQRSLQRETGSQIRAPILRKEAGGKIKVEKL